MRTQFINYGYIRTHFHSWLLKQRFFYVWFTTIGFSCGWIDFNVWNQVVLQSSQLSTGHDKTVTPVNITYEKGTYAQDDNVWSKNSLSEIELTPCSHIYSFCEPRLHEPGYFWNRIIFIRRNRPVPPCETSESTHRNRIFFKLLSSSLEWFFWIRPIWQIRLDDWNWICFNYAINTGPDLKETLQIQNGGQKPSFYLDRDSFLISEYLDWSDCQSTISIDFDTL